MCVARLNSVLTSLPPLPWNHSLSTPSPLPPSWMFECHHQAAPMGIAVRPWRLVCVTALHTCSAQSPSPSCSPSLPLLPCCALTARCFAHREEQEHSPGSRTCGPLTIALLRANLQLSPLLILCSLLLCAISHSMDAMPCHLLQVCVQGAGVGQEREPSNLQLTIPAPQIRFSTHWNADYIFKTGLITLINALAVPKSARFWLKIARFWLKSARFWLKNGAFISRC